MNNILFVEWTDTKLRYIEFSIDEKQKMYCAVTSKLFFTSYNFQDGIEPPHNLELLN